VSDASVPWLVAAYLVAFVLLGGYALRLVLARRRRDGGPRDAAK
jgi:CcmD family protein